jgi:hypothetical protein
MTQIMNRTRRLYTWAVLTILLALLAAPASAQYKPRPLNDPATGEKFHIEGGADFRFPTTEIIVASGGTGALSGLTGTQIDAKRDLGLTDKRLPKLQLMLRPARSHKFRLEYIPITYDASTTLTRNVDFNGQRYRLGLPANTTLDWKAYRFAYEFDFVTKNRGFAGFIIEAKYTDVTVQLTSPVLNEFATARAPLPALGGIGRFYVVPNISITAEVTGFKLPDNIDKRYGGHYVDVDIYGTVNFTNNIGVKGGYRSLDMGYLVKQDTGSFTLKGIYFGIVARY